jgi:hypothetical protein
MTCIFEFPTPTNKAVKFRFKLGRQFLYPLKENRKGASLPHQLLTKKR